ncbi:hypothetical protein BCR44DRAFT_1482773 [Catenaria anguillulae PL171]|uniref:Uncharacterized protein n=1 Tax=Catenaria anguillulae PL171 TaxID=765915 RepID=A0A1Y2HY53_9FUNG|nr:hypothetical protein BCR44DRAFT_1482773 [Catenaria anguillulae PL171]
MAMDVDDAVDPIIISTDDDDDIIDMTPETPAVPQTQHRLKRSSTVALGPDATATRQRLRRVSPNRLAPHNRPVTPTPTSSLIPPPDGFFDLFKASVAYRQPVVAVPKLPPGLPPGIRWVAQTLFGQFSYNVTRAQIRDAIQEVMDLLRSEPSESLNKAHRMRPTEVSANVRVIMFGLRMCVIAVAKLVAMSKETEASVAMACHEGHLVTVAERPSNKLTMQPIINDLSKLSRFLAIDPILGTPPTTLMLTYVVSWVAQKLNDNTWLPQNRCHYPQAVYVLQLVAVTNAMHRSRVSKFDHVFFPLLQIYSRLGITATPMGHDPMQFHPEYQLLLALKAHGVTHLSRFVALIRRMRIASISQPMLHAMMELLAFYRLWKKMFPHIPPPPFTIIWDGDNREPSQDFLEQAQVKWVDIHVHALQAKWTNWICKSTNTRVGTFHTAVRHASESADFEAMFQLVANFPALRFRPLARRLTRRVVWDHASHTRSHHGRHAHGPETLATASTRATHHAPSNVAKMVEGVFAHNFGCETDAFLGKRPDEVSKLLGQRPPSAACGHAGHEHGQGQAQRKKPALPDASRAGWTFWIRSVEDARFWVEWARLCISGYDEGFEKDYYWPGAGFKNISGLFEDDDDE